MSEWPSGFYSPAKGWPVRIIAIPELPATPETLVLRLMGKGKVLDLALQELALRKEKVPELDELAQRAIDFGQAPQTESPSYPDWEEFKMHARKLISEIREDGEKIGIEKGLSPFLRVLSKRLGRPIAEREQQHIGQHLRQMGGDVLYDTIDGFDNAALEAWLQTPPDPVAK